METLPALPESQVDSLISLAITNNVSVEALQSLLLMRRELNAENAKKAFDADMAAFQAAVPTIKKTRAIYTKSGQLAYRYAPIESIVAQVKELLSQHNFSYAIKTETLEGKVTAICIAKHSLGHQEESSMTVPLGTQTPVMSDTQRVAAAITFAKRYAFCNAFGILTGDEDTDAIAVKAKVSAEQLTEIRELLEKASLTEAQMLSFYKLSKAEDMPEERAERVIARLEAIIKKKEEDSTENGIY